MAHVDPTDWNEDNTLSDASPSDVSNPPIRWREPGRQRFVEIRIVRTYRPVLKDLCCLSVRL